MTYAIVGEYTRIAARAADSNIYYIQRSTQIPEPEEKVRRHEELSAIERFMQKFREFYNKNEYQSI